MNEKISRDFHALRTTHILFFCISVDVTHIEVFLRVQLTNNLQDEQIRKTHFAWNACLDKTRVRQFTIKMHLKVRFQNLLR